MKRVAILLVAMACLGGGAAAPAASHPRVISVMTRNLYIGGDLGPLVTATTPAEFAQAVQTILTQIGASNFPERAAALADEIASRKPHLVGLQEVFRITLNGATAAPPFRDQLDDLLDALAARGVEYEVAAQVRNLDVGIPTPMGLVRATDRDVVLARADVETSPVHFDGCRASLDGCNYRAFVSLPSPLGPINIERGFAAIDARVDGQDLRFVNTHLEVPELPLVVQAAQATELIATLQAQAGVADRPVVIVGDINSAPEDRSVLINGEKIVPPYRQLKKVGYIDVWTLRPRPAPGFTCCQATDLLNPESQLFKRVDVIFSSAAPGEAAARRTGADEDDRTASGLWPSDHTGVVAKLRFDY
jgi:endonuclease/exonuclease/phosphatase family metal-dependent hydrolase